jgi:hypothetical protein
MNLVNLLSAKSKSSLLETPRISGTISLGRANDYEEGMSLLALSRGSDRIIPRHPLFVRLAIIRKSRLARARCAQSRIYHGLLLSGMLQQKSHCSSARSGHRSIIISSSADRCTHRHQTTARSLIASPYHARRQIRVIRDLAAIDPINRGTESRARRRF